VTLRDDAPCRVEAAGIAGAVLACAGPWRTAGEWWTDTAWSREEWDVALPDSAVYRLVCDRASGAWTVEADFIAAAQVLIYVGGILVLIIFAVMLTHRITDVKLGSRSAADDKKQADAAAKTERQRLEEAAAKQAAEDAALAAKLAKAAAPAKASAAKTDAKPATKTTPKAAAKPATKATTKTSAAKADTSRTPRAKTQSGAADAKPAAKPKAKRASTKKDE